MGLNKQELREAAQSILEKTHYGRVRPTSKERDVLIDAYWATCLPKHTVYSLYQWVEDGFPTII